MEIQKKMKEVLDNENLKNRGASEDTVKLQSRYKELDTTDISNEELSYNSLMAQYNMNIMKFQDENKIFEELNPKINNSNKIKHISYDFNRKKNDNKMNHKSFHSFDKIYNKEEKNILKKQFNNIDLDKNLMKIYNNNNYIIPHSEDKNNIFKIRYSNILNNNNLDSTKIKEINIKRRNVFNFNKIKNQVNKEISIDSNNKLSINKEEFSFKNMNIINPNLNSRSYLNIDRNI